MKQRPARKSAKMRNFWPAVGVVVALVIVAGAFAIRHHQQTASLTVKPSVSGTPVQGPAKTGSAPAGPEASGATPVATPTVTSNPSHPVASTLAPPVGPNDNVQTMSLSAQSTNMESTCQSVAGASCLIRAISGSQTVVVGASQTIPGTDTV
jgi:hypothetical protein